MTPPPIKTCLGLCPGRRRDAALAAGVAVLLSAIGLGTAPAHALDTQAFRAGYRQVLLAWAEGHDQAAIDQLVMLERAAAPRGTEGETDDLLRAKLRVVRDLLDEPSEVLVPVILLHHDTYLRHRDDRNYPLAGHSRRMTEELVDVYADRSGTEGGRVTSARILTSLAGHLLGSGMSGAAVQNFNRALDLDPRDGAALLSLAVLAEKIGRTEEAGTILDRLLKIDPNHREALLRRAVVRRRLNQTEDAERGFRALMMSADEGAADWIAELAVQELARLYLDSRRETAAQTLLRDSLPRFPQSQRMRILLAYVEDRAERRGLSRATGAEALALEATPEATPRLRYNAYPNKEIDRVRASMIEALTARRALLARALASTASSGGQP